MENKDWVYSEEVKAHFLEPKNVLYEDESTFKYNGRGMVGNMVCGDQMVVLLQVKNDKIVDIRWKTYGCASAIASTSMMSEVVKGMTLKEAYEVESETVAKKLGGLPKKKFHCSVLGIQALKKAIDNYREQKCE